LGKFPNGLSKNAGAKGLNILKQKLLLILAFVVLALILIGLNAASYSPPVAPDETETHPDRSSFNAHETGTRAFYTLLAETGRNVARWERSPEALLPYSPSTPRTFVAVGPFKREFTQKEIDNLLAWVGLGGCLVIIDRDPRPELFNVSDKWKIAVTPTLPIYSDEKSENVARLVQPSIFSANVNSVQASKYAAQITVERLMSDDVRYIDYGNDFETPDDMEQEPDTFEPTDEFTVQSPSPTPVDLGFGDDSQAFFQSGSQPQPPPPAPKDYKGPISVRGSGTGGSGSDAGTTAPNGPPPAEAPVIHLAASNGRDILLEQKFGYGRIIILSDPYIISNHGIGELDNMQLALNLVDGHGPVVFDEYHHGFGSNNNRLLEYFAGTPIVPIFLQVIVLIGLVMFSQSRRFARPVDEPEPNRLSKLEYVSAMAELQSRTKAYDLALENIYGEFRRRVSRFFGIDNSAEKRGDIARAIAERIGEPAEKIDGVMFKCEDIIRGEPTNKKETVRLVSELRAIEEKLGALRGQKARI
jgi:hypothetical protein